MAKLKILKGVLGELIKDKMMPDVNIGALGNIDNQNIKNIMPSQKQLETTDEAIKMISRKKCLLSKKITLSHKKFKFFCYSKKDTFTVDFVIFRCPHLLQYGIQYSY